MRLVFSDRAEADLEDIADYIAADNPRRAVSFVLELREACGGLTRSPYRFPVVEGFARLGYRRRVHERYIIVYVAKDDAVVIVRVLSAAKNLHRALGSDN